MKLTPMTQEMTRRQALWTPPTPSRPAIYNVTICHGPDDSGNTASYATEAEARAEVVRCHRAHVWQVRYWVS